MRKFYVLLLGIFFLQGMSSPLIAQNTQSKYWILFTDKDQSPFTRNEPAAFLSAASIERRARQHIAISIQDLPISPVYIADIEAMGIRIEARSKWLNAVSAFLDDAQIAELSTKPFVAGIQPVRRYITNDEQAQPLENNVLFRSMESTETEGMFGTAQKQIDQINLDTILDLGYNGSGMRIAILDAGFWGADTAYLFHSFMVKEQFLGVRNFPDHNNQVFNIGSGIHGSWVLSTMGGDIPGSYSGSAPDAKFYLYRTEVADSEHVVEEDYWLNAAEWADSVGADIINSSLGYTVFDNPDENHTTDELDGNTTVVTNAGDWAASKGILVVNSAGNEGAGAWHYISMPADGDSVFAIGAVDTAGVHASFSGFGPSADGRVKPDIVALGVGSALLDPNGYYVNLSGTSFSSPLIAGACASLWQAFPDATNMDVLEAVRQSAHLYLTPNDSMGYGIPNFGLAYEILLSQIDTVVVDTTQDTTINTFIDITPLGNAGIFSAFIQDANASAGVVEVFNIQGALVYRKDIAHSGQTTWKDIITLPAQVNNGTYLVRLRAGSSACNKMLFVFRNS